MLLNEAEIMAVVSSFVFYRFESRAADGLICVLCIGTFLVPFFRTSKPSFVPFRTPKP